MRLKYKVNLVNGSPTGIGEGIARRFVAEGAKVIEGVDYSGLEGKIKDAANACPVQVIMYDET